MIIFKYSFTFTVLIFMAFLGLFLSFPILDLWIFGFVSYAILAYVFVYSESILTWSNGKTILFFFLFWFLKRVVEFESIFQTAANYFKNSPQGYFFTVFLFLLLAAYSTFLSLPFLLLRNYLKKDWQLFALFVLSMIFINFFNDIYLPAPPELIMFQNKYILASLNLLSPYVHKIFFFSFSCFLASIARTRRASLLVISVFAFGVALFFISGQRALSQKHFITPKMYLIQTNQSVLRPSTESIQQIVDKTLDAIPSSEVGEGVVLVWPESFGEEKELVNYFQKIKKGSPKITHLIGTYTYSQKGIINNLSLIESNTVKSRYYKNVLFPIGERSISLPLIPERLTKVNVPVLSFDKMNSLQTGEYNFLPLLCYESVIDRQYSKAFSQRLKNKFNIFLNISKDSFYESTSLVKLHSLYSRMKSSTFKTPMIRVSSTEGTEVISSKGEILIRAPRGQFSVIKVESLY